MEKRKVGKVDVILLTGALIVWLVSFLYEGVVFQMEYRTAHIADYVLCRMVEFYFIFFAFRFVYFGIKRNEMERNVIKYGIPYYLFLSVVHMLAGVFPFQGDDLNVYNAVQKYDVYRGAFTYFTGYFYMVCLMLIPAMIAIVQIKILFQALVVGYIIWRLRRIYHSKICYVTYLIACLPWVIILGISVARMPIYAVLYAFFVCLLYCDYKENKRLSRGKLVFVSVLVSVLTWWRSEGIYLFLLGTVLICVAYKASHKSEIRNVCLVLIITQLSLSSLQMIPLQVDDEFYIKHRMAPFYGYTVTIMQFEGGVDEEKNLKELKLIDKYISLQKIEELNEKLGKLTYNDVYIMFPDGYRGVRESATEDDYTNFVKAVQKLMIKNPIVLAKAKLHAWNWISFSWLYKESYSGLSTKGKIMKVILGITGNLYIPLLVLIYVCIWSLKQGEWLHASICLCGLCHGGLSFLLMPAAYFKYFYIMYLLGTIYLTSVLVWWVRKKQFRICKNLRREA